ncbi:cuticle protein 19-like [Uranotaenia lowii]|uniref:cuticle protein 19-like n=1 Tax=Uranotaenia lowii TaxID=190385 RepID=UPI002479B7C8|nr:cuticle protein 19-like [Uranotaenia lowii]
MLKIIAFICCLSVVIVSGGFYQLPHYEQDYYAHPKYKFEYGVKDILTGDHKSQWEQRDGQIVTGSYSLDEADGTHRIVTYNSDDHNGFHAYVHRVGHAQHPHGESYSHIDQHHG